MVTQSRIASFKASLSVAEPELTGTETDAERLEKRRAQADKNAVDMTRLLYTDKADLTLGILPLFVVLDKDEEQPPTRVLASAMSRALRDVDFMDFEWNTKIIWNIGPMWRGGMRRANFCLSSGGTRCVMAVSMGPVVRAGRAAPC